MRHGYRLELRTRHGPRRLGELLVADDTLELLFDDERATIDLHGVGLVGVVPGDGRGWTTNGRGEEFVCDTDTALLIRTGDRTWRIPSPDAESVAEVVAARVRALTGRAPRTVARNRPEPDRAESPEARVRRADALLAEFGVERPVAEGGHLATARVPDPAPGRGVGIVVRLVAAGLLLAAGLLAVPLTLLLTGTPGALPRPLGSVLTALGVLLVGVFVRRPHRWIVAAVAGPGLFGAVTAWGATGTTGRWAGVTLATVAVLAAVAAFSVATRPLSRDVAASGLTVRVRLRGVGARLCLEPDRITVEHGQRVAASTGRVAVPLGRVTRVQSGHLTRSSTWILPDGGRIPLTPGPAVRLLAEEQQWVLPVRDPHRVAAAVATRVRARAEHGDTGPEPMPDHQWREVRRAVRTERTARPRRLIRGVGGLLLGWLLGGALTVAAVVAPVVTDTYEFSWVATLFVGVPTLLAFAVWRITRTDFRLAELHPVPAGTGPWGETRPDRAPVPGWQPGAGAPCGALSLRETQ